jgi:hypothetical protein
MTAPRGGRSAAAQSAVIDKARPSKSGSTCGRWGGDGWWPTSRRTVIKTKLARPRRLRPMIRLPAGNLFASVSFLAGVCKFLQVGRRQLRESGNDVLILDLDDAGGMIRAATFLKGAATELRFVVCKAAAADFGQVMDRFPVPVRGGLQLRDPVLSELIAALEYVLKTFSDEINARPVFVMQPEAAALFDQTDPPFGMEVFDAFPSVEVDVAEAALCRAHGRPTACVMHLMRALEVPLQLLATSCGVEANANWNSLLNQIESQIRQRREQRDPIAEQWMAEAATQFRFIKNAWRNHAMHARAAYGESQAREIYNSVGGFLRQLAVHLREQEATQS